MNCLQRNLAQTLDTKYVVDDTIATCAGDTCERDEHGVGEHDMDLAKAVDKTDHPTHSNQNHHTLSPEEVKLPAVFATEQVDRQSASVARGSVDVGAVPLDYEVRQFAALVLEAGSELLRRGQPYLAQIASFVRKSADETSQNIDLDAPLLTGIYPPYLCCPNAYVYELGHVLSLMSRNTCVMEHPSR